MALKLKGVRYEYIEEDLSSKSPLLLHYNPLHKKVPLLLHNGKPIAESLVILEYIDETWKTANPLLPRHPYQKAKARFWGQFIDHKCWPPLLTAYRCRGVEQDKAKEEVCELLKLLDTELGDQKFFGGDTSGLVDTVASLIAFWLRVIQEFLGVDLLTEEKFPNLWNWAEGLVGCSTIKESLPPKDKLLQYFHSRSA